MFKDRSFLFGLGAGLAAGAILLQLTIGVKDVNNKALFSEQEIRQLAENKGFVLSTKKEIDDLKAKAATASSAPKVSESPKPAAAVPAASPSASPAAASPSTAPAPASTASPEALRISITDGMGSKEVAAYLVEEGVISDKVVFEQRIRDRGVEAKLKKGTYLMKPKMKTDDVIDVLIHTSN